MAPFIGINSNLGRDSAPKEAPIRPPLISWVPAEARRNPTEPRRSSNSVRFDRLLPQVRLRRLLSRIYKGLLDNPGSDIPDIGPDRKLGPEVGILDGHQCEPYVFVQPRRPERGGDLPDLRAVIDDLQVILYVPHQGVAFDLDPDHLATDSLLRDAFEGLFADEVGLLVELDCVLQPHLVGVQERVIAVEVVVQRYVGAVAEDARLDAPDLARPDDREVVGIARLEHRVPEPHAVMAGVPEIDLVPHLAGVTGPGDDDGHAVEIVLGHPIVLDVKDLLTEEVDHEVPGLGTLYLNRGHVGLPDLHVQVQNARYALGPQQYVSVGDGEPEVVLPQAQQHGVVDDPTVHVGIQRELALCDLTFGQIARREHVREVEGVGARNLDLPLYRHVP